MDIKPYDKTIRELLLSGRQFSIPRFQREYSWDKKNYQEFFEDMVNSLTIDEGIIAANPYFFGTMLFVGNYAEGTDQQIDVVDGQQRLTTITILFSALSDRFLSLREDTLSEQIFKYIMTKDDNGDDVRILKSKTHYPFFAYYIQNRYKEISQEPSNEEELCIKDTYDYLYKQLDENRLKAIMKRKHGTDVVNALDYIQILKAIRDQVLKLTFVSISTKDKEQANMIFEILNAKGKRLAHIDLIKNKLFEILKETEPVDYAEDYWNKTKNILNAGKETVGFATYYRHFWISKYKKSTSSKIYDDFINLYKPKNEKQCKDFMVEMYKNAKYYMQIINPKREDYDNRKEYYWLVQSLNVLNNYFNIIQVRIALLALYELKEKNIIDYKIFKQTIQYLEGFHLAYNAIISGRSNRFEKIYSDFAIELRKSKNKGEAQKIIKVKLIEPLEKIFPSYKEFSSHFVKLTYSKKDNPNNVKTKYIINKLNCDYSKEELFSDNGSIEHIIPEEDGDLALNIGNLILLEGKLNKEADSYCYQEKVAVYEKSKYPWVTQFVEQHQTWKQEEIVTRALELAKYYYTKILNRNIHPNL